MKKMTIFWALALCLLMLAACGAEAGLCAHEREGDCALCALEQQIEALPGSGEMLAMDDAGRNAVYTQAQAAAEACNALTEEEQAMVRNLPELIALHEAFNQLTEPIAQ